jgi:Zn-dependent protease
MLTGWQVGSTLTPGASSGASFTILPLELGPSLHRPLGGLVPDVRRALRDAGPTMNIALAMLAALAFHLIDYLPETAAPWVAANLKNALIVNVVLAVFNMFPLPPLDGGRIAVGVLPDAVASPLARLEPYGMLIRSPLHPTGAGWAGALQKVKPNFNVA